MSLTRDSDDHASSSNRPRATRHRAAAGPRELVYESPRRRAATTGLASASSKRAAAVSAVSHTRGKQPARSAKPAPTRPVPQDDAARTEPAPAPRRRPRRGRAHSFQQRLFEYGDKLVHEIVARMLLVVAIVVLVDTTFTFVTYRPFSAEAAMAAVADVMVAVIIVEIMRTVQTHFDNGIRRLQAFLVIGIISAVREVLATSADLSLRPQSPVAASHTVLLLVSAAVVVCLTASLVLIRRLGSSPNRAG